MLARRELVKAFTDGQKWSLDRVEIQRFPDEITGTMADFNDRWFYEISFKPPESAKSRSPELEYYSIFVLTDGSVVAPKETPASLE